MQEIGGNAWTDERLSIHINDGVEWVKTIKDNWIKGGPDSIAKLMRGIVGPCIIEIQNNNDVWFPIRRRNRTQGESNYENW